MKLTYQLQLCVLFLMLILSSNVVAQEKVEKPSLDRGSIASQFDYVYDESTNYMEYKMVKRYWMRKLKSHIQDTLSLLRNQIKESDNTITLKNKEIDTLNVHLAKTNDELINTIKEKNSISLLGIKMDKRVYNSIMSIIIIGLILLLIIFIIMYKRSNKITSQTKNSLSETKEEFEAHRKWALAREQKLMRELHDEKIKNKVRQS